jgi:hypothetical protein
MGEFQPILFLVHTRILLFRHNDLAWAIRNNFQAQVAKADLRQDLSKIMHTDIPRIRAGRLGGQVCVKIKIDFIEISEFTYKNFLYHPVLVCVCFL